MFPEGVVRVGDALLQIPREVQLFAQRASALNRFRLTPLPFPDFMCGRKQVTNVLCKDKQATIVICKGYITAFHEKIPEPRRMQCRGIPSVEP